MAAGREFQLWEPIANLMALISGALGSGQPPAPADFLPDRLGGWSAEKKADWLEAQRKQLPKTLTEAERDEAFKRAAAQMRAING